MPAVWVKDVEHRYRDRVALHGVSLEVAEGEIFGLLGPNGGGKTTLFRLLSTLLPLQHGAAEIFGQSVQQTPDAVRRLIGVTFQSPSLDGKLTVQENLWHQGRLYGLGGAALKSRIHDVLAQLGVADRSSDFAEKLSGGLKRRVEIAKSLLHAPRVLLLDEPSTGLDPGARHELWKILQTLRDEQGTTILVTTHLMEEADRCTQLAILHEGQLIARGRPDELRGQVGGDSLTIQAERPDELRGALEQRYQINVQKVGDVLRVERESGHELLAEIAQSFPGAYRSITLGKPTLEDVFIKLSGRRFDEPQAALTNGRGRKGGKHG